MCSIVLNPLLEHCFDRITKSIRECTYRHAYIYLYIYIPVRTMKKSIHTLQAFEKIKFSKVIQYL